ncbi:MAG TPA: GNAT family protein [Actinocrinis sp.]|uniref:GNAT family N-acetyltransferase n=1 Tax=Actinocrinis sp. TaxID=1920516 RepID=UPI002D69B34A|nr:GNAT family protein [Actinocrinis sp.]HZU58171.1 GNAT family protein [Actinocrinis sp.]
MGLRIRTPRLELRLPTEAELPVLAEAAVKGVYAPGERPFFSKWAERSPEEVARTVVQRQWRKRGAWKPEHWALELAVFEGGQPIGTQEVRAKDFAALREVESASWLGVEYQGRGYGTEMRSAVLHLAFAGLGAAYALSASFVDNASSAAISRKLGYQPDGIQRDANNGEVLVTQRFRLSRAQWESTERPAVSVTGLEPCLDLFGAGGTGENELGK